MSQQPKTRTLSDDEKQLEIKRLKAARRNINRALNADKPKKKRNFNQNQLDAQEKFRARHDFWADLKFRGETTLPFAKWLGKSYPKSSK